MALRRTSWDRPGCNGLPEAGPVLDTDPRIVKRSPCALCLLKTSFNNDCEAIDRSRSGATLTCFPRPDWIIWVADDLVISKRGDEGAAEGMLGLVSMVRCRSRIKGDGELGEDSGRRRYQPSIERQRRPGRGRADLSIGAFAGTGEATKSTFGDHSTSRDVARRPDARRYRRRLVALVTSRVVSVPPRTPAEGS